MCEAKGFVPDVSTTAETHAARLTSSAGAATAAVAKTRRFRRCILRAQEQNECEGNFVGWRSASIGGERSSTLKMCPPCLLVENFQPLGWFEGRKLRVSVRTVLLTVDKSHL